MKNAEEDHNSLIENTDDVYATPETNVDLSLHCPKCNEIMENGYMRSSSRMMWVGDSHSAVKKAVWGGEAIPLKRSGLGCKYPSNYCKSCQLFILRD